MSGTNLKPPNTEKCCTINSCVDIQINTGALCAFNTILWGKKAFKNIILFFLAFLIAARCYVMQKSMHSFYIIALNRIFFTNVTIRENNCWFQEQRIYLFGFTVLLQNGRVKCVCFGKTCHAVRACCVEKVFSEEDEETLRWRFSIYLSNKLPMCFCAYWSVCVSYTSVIKLR